MPTPDPEPVAVVQETSVAEEPDESEESEEPIATRPFVPCVPVTDCGIVARHRLASRFARTRGFYESPSGQVACRQPGWEEHGRPDDTFFIEVTESCHTGPGYYIQSGSEIWLPFASGCSLEAGCTQDLAGWEFAFAAIEVPHDARRFAPLGHGFYDDGTHIFDRSEILDDEDVDRTTFHACSTEPDDPMSETFYPVAEDSLGLFGYGEHGDVGRARL